MGRIEHIQGDITELEVDAIVNAANQYLAPGAGVCGSIHEAAGPELASECERLGHCEVGDAKVTKGYNLRAHHVIHTVGPVWHGGSQGEADTLANCYRNSLDLARKHEIRSIAFPAISTGVYGYPPEQAARIAVETVAEFLEQDDYLEKVVFCSFDSNTKNHYESILNNFTS